MLYECQIMISRQTGKVIFNALLLEVDRAIVNHAVVENMYDDYIE